MFKIWAKVIKNEKIISQTVYVSFETFSYDDYFTYLADMCETLDIATPILLKTHLFNFAKFRQVRFLPRDFAEPVPFDKLVLERLE